MTKTKQPFITYIVQTAFIGLIYLFYKEQSNNKQADTFDNFVYRAFAGALILVSLTLTIWTIFRRRKNKFWFGSVLLFGLTVATFRVCYKAVYSLPFGQRFLLKNETAFPLTDITLISDRIERVNSIAPNETKKVVYNFYVENNSIDLTCKFNGKTDTVTLVSGLTNSIGYLFNVKIKLKDNKLKVEVTE